MSAPSSIDIREGTRIPSRKTEYLVHKELGEGGFGSVYKVQCNGEDFALKVTKMWTFMPNERLEYAKRFRQEYEYGSSLNSRFIVRCMDYDTYEGNPFMVLELCDKGSLTDMIGKPVDPYSLRNLAGGILQGLYDLHAEGIIHRDIKPDNILFDSHKTPKLADFGISASVKKRHTVANFMGHAKEVFATGTYSPPEQMDPRQAMKVMGPTNDVYAFGAVMYELITQGGLPFGSFESFMEDMGAYEERKRNEEWNRELLERMTPEPAWVDVIACCLRYKAEDRYQNIKDLMDTLNIQQNNQERSLPVSPDSVWFLEVKNGEEIGRRYNLSALSRSLNKRSLTIGWFNEEDPFSNDIGIAELFTQYISRFHCTLEYDAQSWRWILRDGQFRERNGQRGWFPSTNGVLVDGMRIDEHGTELHQGNIITIGDTTLKVDIQH
jgi:serine/threonine protein kinase